MGPTSIGTIRPGRKDHHEHWNAAIRAAVDSPGFDRPDFVRRLIRYLFALKEDWHRRCALRHERNDVPNPREERLLQQIRDAKGDADRAKATSRYLRWSCAKSVRDSRPENDPCTGAESLTSAGSVALWAFNALDMALLADRSGLILMLHNKFMFRHTLGALSRIGPAAIDFAPLLIEQLDDESDSSLFQGAEALGAISRDDPDIIDGLLKRLRSGSMTMRTSVAKVLEHAGPPLAGRVEVAIDLLLGMTGTSRQIGGAISALASVGRDSEPALRRVLEVVMPRPPRWDPEDASLSYRIDRVMVERSIAIDVLRYFQGFADRVVPVLVDAFDTFEEYDPDWQYNGEHERVCSVLKSFGPEAAPAVPRLIQYLEDWAARPEDEQGNWPKDVFGLLAAIGPKAGAALPILERLRVICADDNVPADALDPDDPLDGAILAIQPDRAGA